MNTLITRSSLVTNIADRAILTQSHTAHKVSDSLKRVSCKQIRGSNEV